jgi:ABC-type branched-subunit amino acid transport system substrate-binding protein
VNVRPRRATSIIVATAIALATAACGARLTAEQTAVARQGAVKRAGATAAAAGNPSAPVAADPQAAQGAPTGTPSAGGSTAGAAGTSGAAPTEAAGATTCTPTPGSTEPGVSDKEITVGNVSTIGGPVPGLAQTVVNGAHAYFAYRNQIFGGVCGRKLTMIGADDRLDAGVNRSETERLLPRVFALVGSFSAVDDGGASVLAGTNITDISLSIGSRRVALPNNFSPNPFDPNAPSNGQAGVFRHFKDAYGVSRGGVVWPAQATARTKGQNFVNDMRTAGIDPLSVHEVALTETNYVGVASKMKSDGVDIVVTALEINGLSRLAQAFQQVGYTPKVAYYGAQAYGSQFARLAGPSSEGTLIALSFDIAENTANPAVATMAQWYRTVNPGSELDTLAIEGWTAAAMFVKALELAGPAPTRDGLLAALGTFHDFDADGLIAPIDAAGKQPPACFLIITIEAGAWRRVEPSTSGFLC